MRILKYKGYSLTPLKSQPEKPHKLENIKLDRDRSFLYI